MTFNHEKARATIIKNYGSWEAYIEFCKENNKKRDHKNAKVGGFAVLKQTDPDKLKEISRLGGLAKGGKKK